MRIFLFFTFINVAFSMTAQLAHDRCQSSMEAIKYPESHSFIDSIKFLKSLVQKKIRNLEKVSATDVLSELADCMDGVDALEWLAKQKAEETSPKQEPEKKNESAPEKKS